MIKLCISIKEHHKSLFSKHLPTSCGYVNSSPLFLLKRERWEWNAKQLLEVQDFKLCLSLNLVV